LEFYNPVGNLVLDHTAANMTKFIDVKQYEEAAAKILSEIEWRIFGETHMCDVENNMNAFRRLTLW